jgi:hypothetical protein
MQSRKLLRDASSGSGNTQRVRFRVTACMLGLAPVLPFLILLDLQHIVIQIDKFWLREDQVKVL